MTPSTRSIAHAIADAVKPRVIAAQQYIDDWRALAIACVPPDDIRHGLDREVRPTEPLAKLREWDGKGCLGLTGAKDSGKSFAAVRWGLGQLRRGRRLAWVSSATLMSWTDVEIELGRARDAHAFVFDDCGVGTLSQHGAFSEKFEAVLVARGQRPSIITSNANRAGLEQWLGPRVLSRLTQAGRIVEISAEAGLRELDEEELDDEGHGGRWRRASRLVATIGCRPDDRFDEASNRVEIAWRVGDKLAASNPTAPQLRELAKRFSLCWAGLERAAEGLEQAAELGAVGLLEALASIKSKPAPPVARYVPRRNPIARPLPLPPALGRAPPWVDDNPKPGLTRLGYVVTRSRPGTKRLGPSWRVEWGGTVLDTGISTERRGWEIAATHAGESLPPGYCETDAYASDVRAWLDREAGR